MYSIYGRMSCPFCKKAVDLCEEQGEGYFFNNVNTQIKDEAAKHNHFTVPIIFKNKRFVGGYEELRKELKVHNTWQKIWWWIVTGYHFFHCKNTYRIRLNARKECILNVRNRSK